MDLEIIKSRLAHLPLGEVEYFESISSTNDRALELARHGAPHFSLVVADEQTGGRGRSGRRWFTPPQTALAFSLVLRPDGTQIAPLSRTTGLGALAVCLAMEDDLYGLNPQIKWPNDVLLHSKKVCGILTEASWLGERLEALVLGIGINVLPGAVPPAEMLSFPAVSLTEVYGKTVERLELLEAILAHLADQWSDLDQQGLIADWDIRLAYKGRMVQILAEGSPLVSGKIAGIGW